MAVPALAGLLGDRNEEVRMYAAIALKKFGTQAAAAVPALIATLKDPGWQVRDRSALALGAVGQHQTSVVSALEEALPFVAASFTDQPLIEARLRLTLGLSFWRLGEAQIAIQVANLQHVECVEARRSDGLLQRVESTRVIDASRVGADGTRAVVITATSEA